MQQSCLCYLFSYSTCFLLFNYHCAVSLLEVQAALLEATARLRMTPPSLVKSSGHSLYSCGQACSTCSRQNSKYMMFNQSICDDERQDLADRLCHAGPPSTWLPGALAALVSRSSRRQTLAGLLATSPGKSLAYVGAKLQKRLRSFR
jgi:Phosphatidate cytidylyltransferase, mitochondrial